MKADLATTTMYLRLRLETATGRLVASDGDLDVLKAFSSAADSALLSLYGVVGSSTITYELITPEMHPGEIIVSVPTKQHRRFWAALTMLTSVQKKPARCVILKATPDWEALFDDASTHD